ncbi:hypothetical protein RJ45_09460 [Photobacterium gaetbulicola]|uniref:Uncharacterized protein n=1 Tax=Photobacterium gaetbulicola TaxID=1295392 RepID=A0A0B9GGK8_9GAMM|nr:hypothetical protein [Photobacterium gaetbulicola]KHT63915.1 hypothetical protein RJ45_09460 [Photobacterium gaetbulicola]
MDRKELAVMLYRIVLPMPLHIMTLVVMFGSLMFSFYSFVYVITHISHLSYILHGWVGCLLGLACFWVMVEFKCWYSYLKAKQLFNNIKPAKKDIRWILDNHQYEGVGKKSALEEYLGDCDRVI